MDPEHERLLHNAEANLPSAKHAGRSEPQHLCSRCSSELGLDSSFGITFRLVLMSVAILLSVTIFSLLVAHMTIGYTLVLSVFVTIWTGVTIAILIVLLCMGRRRHSHRKLGRTVTQIRVLCALAFSWILLMFGMITQNVSDSVCGRWQGDDCGLFTSAHVLSWILILTLLLAAYATYRRAVTIHGVVMVPLPAPPPMVPAWHLSGVADGEGSVKI
ncbi:hypothetical protein B0H13DRAFT_1970710 [Mycena leptocephala]|nr:hypothetical protein B0H13DRAFT_1970710 [Mycena leptocephala]